VKKLLAVVVVLLVVVGVVGFGRGWFTVTRDNQPEGTNVNLHIDTEKIQADREAARGKVKDTVQEFRDDIREDTEALEAEQ